MTSNYGERQPFQELTEEQKQYFGDYFDTSESDSDLEFLDDSMIKPDQPNSDESDFDEPGTETEALQDIALIELQNFIKQENVEALDQTELFIDDVAETSDRGQMYTGKGKSGRTVWWSMESETEKVRTDMMKRSREQSFGYCKDTFDKKKEAFMRVFPPSIIDQIVIETNRKAKRFYDENEGKNSSIRVRPWKDTDTDEMYALIAILLYAGAEKANKVEDFNLFAKSNMPFYRAVMPLVRFQQLIRFIRFDDSQIRLVRLRQDKLAPIRHIWNLFLNNLTMAYAPSLEMCTVEQMLTTRNKCSFRQYIPSKSGKYGIKIFWLVDATNNFPLSAEIYVGQQPNENRSTGIAHDLVLRLTKPFFYMGANITMGKFFTSYELAEALMEKLTTLVGTISKNKCQIPKYFTSIEEAKERGPMSSIFCFSNACELVSFTTHTMKNIVLLSTAHATQEIIAETKKPIVIHDYNKYKGSMDTFNKILRSFTTERKCHRWPMLIFFNMIDVAGLAAFRLFELSNPAWKANRSNKRKMFLKELAMELAHNQLEKRCNSTVVSSVKIALNLIGYKSQKTTFGTHKMPAIHTKNPNRRCEECKKYKDRRDNKTTAVCDFCIRPTCSLHYVRTCQHCYQTRFKEPNSVVGSDEEEDYDEPGLSQFEPPSKKSHRNSTTNR